MEISPATSASASYDSQIRSSNSDDASSSNEMTGSNDVPIEEERDANFTAVNSLASSSPPPSVFANKSYDDDDDEEDVCRICRNPGDADNPLRYPCACSGSIKFVHQDCLLQWLNHSNARQCEV